MANEKAYTLEGPVLLLDLLESGHGHVLAARLDTVEQDVECWEKILADYPASYPAAALNSLRFSAHDRALVLHAAPGLYGSMAHYVARRLPPGAVQSGVETTTKQIIHFCPDGFSVDTDETLTAWDDATEPDDIELVLSRHGVHWATSDGGYTRPIPFDSLEDLLRGRFPS